VLNLVEPCDPGSGWTETKDPPGFFIVPDDVPGALVYDTFTIDENYVGVLTIIDTSAPECGVIGRNTSQPEDPFSPQFIEQLPATFRV
jgi:hypothetical protein